MRVHLIKEKTIEEFVTKHASGKGSFKLWLNLIKSADWNVPEDLLSTFGSADLLGNGSERIVFDIGGNNYRIIAKYDFAKTRVHLTICWMGTHAEYTKLCKANKQYDIRMY
jgi:mRNA interferase HigB